MLFGIISPPALAESSLALTLENEATWKLLTAGTGNWNDEIRFIPDYTIKNDSCNFKFNPLIIYDTGNRNFDASVIKECYLDLSWPNQAVLRIGRQMLAWGKGYYYSPVDQLTNYHRSANDLKRQIGTDVIAYKNPLAKGGFELATRFDQDMRLSGLYIYQNFSGFDLGGYAYTGVAEAYGVSMAGDLGAGFGWHHESLFERDSAVWQHLLGFNYLGGSENIFGISMEYYYNGKGAVVFQPGLMYQLWSMRDYLLAHFNIRLTNGYELSLRSIYELNQKSNIATLGINWNPNEKFGLYCEYNILLGETGTLYGTIPVNRSIIAKVTYYIR